MKKLSMFVITILFTFIGINIALADDTLVAIINDGPITTNCTDCTVTSETINVADDKVTISYTTNSTTHQNGSFVIDASGQFSTLYQKIKNQGIRVEIPSTGLTAVTLQGKYNGTLKTASNNAVTVAITGDDSAEVSILSGKYGNVTVNSGNLTTNSGTYNNIIVNGGGALIGTGTYGSLNLTDGNVIINGSTFNGSSDSNFLLTNTDGTLRVDEATFYNQKLLYQTGTENKSVTILNDISSTNLATASTSGAGAHIYIEDGTVNINGGEIDFTKLTNDSNDTGIFLDEGTTLNISRGIIKSDVGISNSGTINYGDKTQTESMINPTLYVPRINNLNGEAFNFENGVVYLNPSAQDTFHGWGPIGSYNKLHTSREGFKISNTTETIDNVEYYKYYLEDQTKWIAFQNKFNDKINEKVEEYNDYDGIGITMNVTTDGNTITVVSSANLVTTGSEPVSLTSTLTYENGIITYADNFQLNEELNSNNYLRNMQKGMLESFVIEGAISAISDIYGYDEDAVYEWIENNIETLKLDKDGFEIFDYEEKEYEDDGENAIFDSVTLIRFSSIKMDLLNGFKTLPKPNNGGGSSNGTSPEPVNNGNTNTSAQKEDVDVDGSTGTGAGVSIVAIILLAGTAYIIRTKSNKKLFKI